MSIFIALGVGYVAWRQHKTAQDKLRFDIFEERVRVYGAIYKLFYEYSEHNCVDSHTYASFMDANLRAGFLFGNEIVELLGQALLKMKDLPVAEDLSQIQMLIDDDSPEAKAIEWFWTRVERLGAMFLPYLEFHHVARRTKTYAIVNSLRSSNSQSAPK